MTLSRYILWLLLLAIPAVSAAGDGEPVTRAKKFLKNPQDKTLFEKAEQLYEEGNYLVALSRYKKLEEKYPTEEILRLRVGSCLTYKSDGAETALQYLSALDAKKLKKTDHGFFLGRSLHLNYKFDDAITTLTEYVSLHPAAKYNTEAQRIIEYSTNAKVFFSSPLEAKIDNLKSPINSNSSEYVPVISSDESVMIFTYRGEKSTGGLMNASYEADPEGEYSEDVFISYKENGSWTTPVSIGPAINTNKHDAAIALSNDGQKLFIYRDSEGGGDIYISYLNGKDWSEPVPLPGEVNTGSWEGSASLSADEKTLYFSSEKPGGFGGRDIYVAKLKPDGTWGDVMNMGAAINTAYDDDAPFIQPDGRLLHFSSNGRNSMGGFDIFRTMMNVFDSTWSEPVNLGYPVNTTGDDIYYVISADGKRGYYSSGKAGGYGEQDIYIVEPALLGTTTLLLALKGTVMIDDKPVEAIVTVRHNGKDKELARFRSNASSGKYLVNLPVGYKYSITYKANEFEEAVEIDATTITTFMETTQDRKFYTAAFRKLKAQKDSLDLLAANDNSALRTGSQPAKASATAQDVINNYGSSSAQGLIFTVQIGAYNHPRNFRHAAVNPLGKVEKKQLEDGITRFTMGTFSNLNEATQLRDKVVGKGIKDAFILAIYNGKRVMIEDLVKQGIFKP